MGWAKYTEDINELISERIMLIDRTSIDTEVKIAVRFEIPNIAVATKQGCNNSEEYSDISIICRDCGKKFVFSAKSQTYFDKQGWNAPQRCKCCREHRNTVFLMHASH